MGGPRFIHLSDPDAQDVYLNDENLPFDTEDVQDGFEKIVNQIDVSASPGFTWGQLGNLSSGTWFLNDSVPSNKTGRLIPITSGEITELALACENATTVTVTVYKRTDPGPVFTAVGTISLSGQRKKVKTVSIPVVKEDELAVQVTSGSVKNPVLEIIIKGTS